MPALNIQHYIHKIELDEKLIVRRNPLVDAERAAAIRDLLDSNTFKMPGNDHGPYYVRLHLDGHRLHFHIRDCLREELPAIVMTLSPFRRLIKDYFMVCESYQAAYTAGSTQKLEAIDMARRGLHNEGATLLKDRLEPSAETDFETARCLFTLICVLHIGMAQPW